MSLDTIPANPERTPGLSPLPSNRDTDHVTPSCHAAIVPVADVPSTSGPAVPLRLAEPAAPPPAKGYGSTRTTPKKFCERIARRLREQSRNRNFTEYQRNIYGLAAAIVDAAADGRPVPYTFANDTHGPVMPPAPNVTRFEITPEEFFRRLDARLNSQRQQQTDGARSPESLFARAAAWLNFQAAAIDGGNPKHTDDNPDRAAMRILFCVSTGRPLPERYRKHIDAPAPLAFPTLTKDTPQDATALAI